jgi:hypothetical protein
MPSPYLGAPANVTYPAAGTITNVTNANPMVVTVSGSLPAQMVATGGGPVDISGVQGCTAANGLWPTTTVTGSNTFSIPAAGNAAYTTGGSVSFQFPASYNTPNDGDSRNAASVGVPLDALGDRTLANIVNTGGYKLTQFFSATNNDDTGSAWITGNPGTSGVWAAAGTPVIWTINALLSGDLVEVSLTGTIETNYTTAQEFLYGLMYAFGAPGTSPSFAKLPGSGINPAFLVLSDPRKTLPAHVAGYYAPSSAGSLQVTPGFYVGGTPVGAGGQLNWLGDYTLFIRVWRPTGVPQ